MKKPKNIREGIQNMLKLRVDRENPPKRDKCLVCQKPLETPLELDRWSCDTCCEYTMPDFSKLRKHI